MVRICIAEDDRPASRSMALIAPGRRAAPVGCSSNATDERSVEDRSDAGAPDVDGNQTLNPLRSPRRLRTR